MPGLDFITMDFLPSVLVLINANQILNESQSSSNKYISCLCRFIGKLYILLLTFLVNFVLLFCGFAWNIND